MAYHKLTLIFLIFSFAVHAQDPCVNGTVNGYPCNQIDFYGNLSNGVLAGVNGTFSNDIWGWTDPNTNKEYALVGQTNGVVFVDVSNPANPRIVGRLPSHTGNSSSWRDVKVFKNHAFIVADNNAGHGMQVFDLTRLRASNNAPVDFNNDAHYNGVSSAHNIVINEETGFAYIVGARNAGNGCGAGGLHIVDINNPKSPVFAGCFDVDGYTHDAQCVIYNGPDPDYQGKEICFNANENTITIANVEDKENTVLLSLQGYPQSAYSHQGWLTEDHQFFISNDELDENNFDINTRTLVWDVRNLDNPRLLTQYFSERSAIDHNVYTHENRLYQSNYTNGLIVLDINRIAEGNIREIAYFDTYPQSDNTSFDGTWSNYPYFESGIVIVSDINNGLFILKPNFNEIISQHPIFESCNENLSLSVATNAGFDVSSYQWQTLENNQVVNLTNNSTYSGTNTAELTINSAVTTIEDNIYRCKLTLTDGKIAYSYYSNKRDGVPLGYFAAEINNLEVNFLNQTLGANSYEWDFGDGSAVSTELNPSHTYATADTYQVTLTTSNNCGQSEFSYPINLSICLPMADFSVDQEGLIATFNNQSLRADNYEWDFGDGSEISTAASPSHTYMEEGSYTVTLKASNEVCGETIFTEIVNIGILSNEASISNSFQLFPNPTIDRLTIRNIDTDLIEKISIIDTDGRVVYQQNKIFANEINLNSTNWTPGMYFVLFYKANGVKAVKKVVKY